MYSPPKKRKNLGTLFLTVLVGLSYPELISTINKPVISGDILLADALLPIVFFFVSVRFYIGNYLLLENDTVESLHGFNWLYDVMIIMLQSLVIIYLAKTASLEASKSSVVGFIDLLVVLYSIDVAWICSQWLFGLIYPTLRRRSIPWGWAVLNAGVVIALFACDALIGNIYSKAGLIAITVINLVGFAVDVVLLDHAKVYQFRAVRRPRLAAMATTKRRR